MPAVNVLEKLHYYAEKNVPLVIFAEPHRSLVQLYVQQDSKLHTTDTFVEDGFVMAAFDSKEATLFLPFKNALHYQEVIETSEIEVPFVKRIREESDQQQHEELVEKGIQFITEGKAEKIVLARKEQVALRKWDPVLLLQNLLNLYPTAFRFMWFHPETGWWCGATPETLVEVQENKFYTMALAGTQAYKGEELIWRAKERDEQQYVTDTILNQIRPLCKEVQVSETYTQPAGLVAHLRTDIQGEILENTDLSKLARAIHPTPAICGTPTLVAKRFILDEEHFDRKYYAGFLGIVEVQNKSRLYVNLRSMSVKNKIASLYIGGGITKDSQPEEEWLETCNKTQTMLRVVKPLLA